MATENPFGELIHDYVAECLPLAEETADRFVELERRWAEGDSGETLLSAVKSQLHTLKGNSVMMGLAPMHEVAHALEDLVARATTSPRFRREDTAALLVDGCQHLAESIRRAAEGPPDADAAAAVVSRVRSFLDRGTEDSDATGVGAIERRRGDRRSGDPQVGQIRIDFRRLDALLEIFGEAMIEQSALPEIRRRLAARLGAAPEVADLEGAITALATTMKRLEGALMEARLLPISAVFGRFTRIVRDLGKSEQKRLRLVTSGGETLLDKSIIDRLGEPLTHLLTNAVVHGVEPWQERNAAGKPVEATLRLDATTSSNRAVVRVSDDGRGLDGERIVAKARALGLDARSDDPEALRSLIFHPGFSTADSVSHLAGRGVGLDIVAASVHALGGTIDVSSEPGRGTCFTLSLPLTLAIVRSLIVEVDRERYAVPLAHVAETVRVAPDAMRTINQRGVVVWRDEIIHVADGGRLLGTGTEPAPRSYYVVLFSGPRRRGLLVDRVVGHQDVVVKGLDPSLGKPDVVSGTTILGDGRVACILDIAGVVDRKVA